MKPVFALVDCNNFFVSCERLFRPELEGKPVIVLSSNDGCAISRSNEAKELGIPMGAPAFKYRDMMRQHGVTQFSANFELYGDMSERITRIMTSITPRTEVYSVDESFLDLSELEIDDYAQWGRRIKQRIQREVGIPVSIGIAPSKTLAKLASDRSKKELDLFGVLDLTGSAESRKPYLLRQQIGDVWGIGRQLAPRMKAEGVFNAYDLSQMRIQFASQLMGVHGRQLVTELGGEACHPLERFGRVRQTVMKGRMFGEDTSDFHVIEAAIATLTARAAFVLRGDGLRARMIGLSLSTNRHKPGYEYLQRHIRLPTPSADTGHITAGLVKAALELYSPAKQFHRANVILYDLTSQDRLQTDVFGEVDVARADNAVNRLAAVDALNKRYGKRTVHFAAENLSQAWQPKHQLRSPRYTTNWHELPVARILKG